MNNRQYIKLSQLCTITMGESPSSDTYNTHKNGIPFYQGNADFGEIHPNTRIWCSLPKKIAHNNDLLISVRAPIGAVNIATETCCIGRGLAALTPDKNCSLNYLFYAVKNLAGQLELLGTGSTFKAINKDILENIPVPYYEKSKQEQISQILVQLDRLISNKKAQINLFDELIKSRFVEMFGDPVNNNKRWPVFKLSQLGTLERGRSKHRPRNDPKLLGGPYPLVQTSEVTSANLFIKNTIQSYSELGLKQSKLWKSGTLCITIAANIAQTAILDFDACFPDSIVGFTPNESINAIFLHYWFQYLQKIIESQATQVAQKNINLKVLERLDVIVPTITLQNQFADFVQQVDKSRLAVQKSLDELEILKKSLMQEYFG